MCITNLYFCKAIKNSCGSRIVNTSCLLRERQAIAGIAGTNEQYFTIFYMNKQIKLDTFAAVRTVCLL